MIAATLRAVLASDHPGRWKSWWSMMVRAMGLLLKWKKIRPTRSPGHALVRQANRGKAVALQRGLAAARTRVRGLPRRRHASATGHAATSRQAVAERNEWSQFQVTPRWATSGRFIARCQSLEYTAVSISIDALTIGGIASLLCPGAISAHPALGDRARGGLSLDTLAEDTDLTLALHKGENRIVYVPAAIAWTEAPETSAHACAATVSLGLWDPAMSLETSRQGFQLALSRPRLV